uniref:Uncharacterized protein n=1 Tax=viral metagenome TaxID=1070528 RepID=A0A6C0CGJ8_9ZZZZ
MLFAETLCDDDRVSRFSKPFLFPEKLFSKILRNDPLTRHEAGAPGSRTESDFFAEEFIF